MCQSFDVCMDEFRLFDSQIVCDLSCLSMWNIQSSVDGNSLEDLDASELVILWWLNIERPQHFLRFNIVLVNSSAKKPQRL